MYKVRVNIVAIVIVAILGLSIAVTVFSSGGRAAELPAYTGGTPVPTLAATPTPEPEFDAPMTTYLDGDAGLSMLVPAEWRHVTQDGWPTFVHPATGASVQVRVETYNPAVAGESEDTFTGRVSAAGGVPVGFQYLSNASYEESWQTMGGQTVWDHMTRVYYDRERMVSLVCVFPDTAWQALRPYYEAVFNSVSWNRTDPVPEGIILVYVPGMGCEIGCPDGWGSSLVDGAAVFTSQDSSATITLSAFTGSGLSNMSQSDIVATIARGRQNFVLSGIETSDGRIWCRSTATAGEAVVQYVDELYEQGGAIYHASSAFLDGVQDPDLLFKCIALLRVFA